MKKIILGIMTMSLLSSCSNMSGRDFAKGLAGAVAIGGLTKFSKDDDKNLSDDELDSEKKKGYGLLALGGLIYYLADTVGNSPALEDDHELNDFDGESSQELGGLSKESNQDQNITKQKNKIPSQDFATAKKEESLLIVLKSTLTPNVSGTYVMPENEARCNVGARKAFLLKGFCMMRNQGGMQASFAPKDSCEEAEKGRKYASTTVGKEVVRIVLSSNSIGGSVSPKLGRTAIDIQEFIRKAEALPKDCEQ